MTPWLLLRAFVLHVSSKLDVFRNTGLVCILGCCSGGPVWSSSLLPELGMRPCTVIRLPFELIQLWEEISGKSVKIKNVSTSELDKIIDNSNTPESLMIKMMAQLKRSAWIRGDCGRIAEGTLDAISLYPEIKVKSVRENFEQLAMVD